MLIVGHFGQIYRWINEVACISRALQWQERGQTSIEISSYGAVLELPSWKLEPRVVLRWSGMRMAMEASTSLVSETRRRRTR